MTLAENGRNLECIAILDFQRVVIRTAEEKMFFEGAVVLAEDFVELGRNVWWDRLDLAGGGGLVGSGKKLLVNVLALALPLRKLLVLPLPHWLCVLVVFFDECPAPFWRGGGGEAEYVYGRLGRSEENVLEHLE